MQKKEYSIEVGGKQMTAVFTDWAVRANGSVIMKYGNTTVLVTAVMGGEKAGLGYFPLSVEYEEKFYAAGKMLGSRYMRREGRPSDEAVLSGRIIDRTIRPLFDHHIRREIQVIATVLSLDEDDGDVLGVIGASLALGVSNIPWGGPVSAVRIGKIPGDDTLIINPVYAQRGDDALLDFLICGKDGLVNMIEVAAREVPEEELSKALELAVGEHTKIQKWQEKIIAEIGKAKADMPKHATSPAIVEAFTSLVASKLSDAIYSGTTVSGLYPLKGEWLAHAKTLEGVNPNDADDYFEHMVDEAVHRGVIEENKRPDGRALDEIRPLFAEAGGISPMIHGTGLFYRGDTHIFSALTLGGPGDAQIVDTIEYPEASKRFMHHYNFPPFSVGETGKSGSTNRRMIGHGALAEKALRAVIPAKEKFPYTIRLVSETLSSNGSSSMGSVCASSLAMMDGGVPITRPVAGIAMGMMSDAEKGVHKVLTDIQGPEDHFGDMDFKVAGTSIGVTGVQMDVKVAGVAVETLMKAFEQAKKARLEILEVLTNALPAPRADISPRAPKILTTKVKVDQIGMIIGPGGKMINGIKDRTGVEEITIDDDGSIFITGKGGAAEAALKEILGLTREFIPGERLEGEVTRLMDFGAFVRIGPNTEGLVHVSEIASFRIAKISDAVAVGDIVPVTIKEIDEKGRYNLSIKEADPSFAERKGLTPAPRENNDGRSHNGGDRGRSNRRF
ncbi:MAG: polyribonucleotide nucleotidyltransferase [Patescibacteria group bacterium]